jgi:hypothetical protein
MKVEHLSVRAAVERMNKHLADELSVGVLSCARCGESQGLTQALVLQYAEKGWPVCCGSTMRYFGPAPGANAGAA